MNGTNLSDSSDGHAHGGWGINVVMIGMVVGQSAISTVTVVGNIMVLVVILRRRNKDRLRTVTNVMIANLAVVDLGIGLISSPNLALQQWMPMKEAPWCALSFILVFIFGDTSGFAYLVICFERFVAMKFPFRYVNLFTRRSVMFMIAVCWIVGLLVHVMSVPIFIYFSWRDTIGCQFHQIMTEEYPVYFWFLLHIIETIIIGVFFSWIFVITLRHKRAMADFHFPVNARAHAASGIKKDIATARKCFSFAIVHFICHLPMGICNSLKLSGESPPMSVVFSAVWIKFINPAINPFLYAFSNKHLKRELKRMLFSCCRKSKYAAAISESTM